MADTDLCCRTLGDLRDVGSPFERIIAFDYYDGAKAGVAQCATCAAAYRFDLLAWDDCQDVRVYGFAVLPPESFARIVEACTAAGPPSWPVWVPATPTSDEIDVARVLEQAGPIEFVLAAEDLSKRILAASRMTEPGPAQDWFALLGLHKKSPEDC